MMKEYIKGIFALLIITAIIPVGCMADQLSVQNNFGIGDVLTISGNMDNSDKVQIWILGKNYWNGASTGQAVQVPTTAGAFSYQLSDTASMPSGTYYIITQAPGQNGLFNVTTKKENGYTLVKSQDGNSDFMIWGTGKLQGSDAATLLKSCIDSSSVDDTYLALTTTFEAPWIRIEPVGDYTVGDQFQILGTTNLASGNTLNININSPGYTTVATTKVASDGAYRIWSYSADTSSWISGVYTVTVSSNNPQASATTSFSLISNPVTEVPTETATAVITQTSTPTPTPTATAVITQTATATPTPVPTAAITQATTAAATPVPTAVQAASSDDKRYDELNAEITALKEQVDEKDSEIEKQNSVIDALVNLIKALFGM